jgi:hypothetical protein
MFGRSIVWIAPGLSQVAIIEPKHDLSMAVFKSLRLFRSGDRHFMHQPIQFGLNLLLFSAVETWQFAIEIAEYRRSSFSSGNLRQIEQIDRAIAR